MKKIVLALACLMLSGCTAQVPDEEKPAEMVYAAARYCDDEACFKKTWMRYDEDAINAIQTFLDELPNITTSTYGQDEAAKLVMIDDHGYQHVYRETVEHNPGGDSYTLNYQGQRISFQLTEDQRLSTFLQGLEGISDNVIMGYEQLPLGSFFVSSYQKNALDWRYALGKKGLELLFYINESFTDVNQIKDQSLLLSGLLKQIPPQSEMSYVLNNRLLIINAVMDQTSVEAMGNSLIKNYQLPELNSFQVNAIDNTHFYYDADNHQFLIDNRNYSRAGVDWLLMPIYEEDDKVRVARFKVYRKETQYGTCFEMVLNHTYSERVYNFESLYEQLVMHLDQVDLFDAVTDSEGRLTSVEVIQLAEPINNTSITMDSFMNAETGDCNLYTLNAQSADAMIYNDFIQQNFSNYRNVRSYLYETDDFIEVEIFNDAYQLPDHYKIFFDKASGRLMSDGMINQQYYEGQLTEKVLDQLKKQGLQACPLSYMEGLDVERCYVEPAIDEAAAPFNFAVPYSKLMINDKHQLVVPVTIKSKGSYQETLKIIP